MARNKVISHFGNGANIEKGGAQSFYMFRGNRDACRNLFIFGTLNGIGYSVRAKVVITFSIS